MGSLRKLDGMDSQVYSGPWHRTEAGTSRTVESLWTTGDLGRLEHIFRAGIIKTKSGSKAELPTKLFLKEILFTFCSMCVHTHRPGCGSQKTLKKPVPPHED